MMEIEEYYAVKRLTKLERRLLDEGYWSFGFTDPNKQEGVIFHSTLKWDDMIVVILDGKNKNQLITEQEIINYLDNPPSSKTIEKIKNKSFLD